MRAPIHRTIRSVARFRHLVLLLLCGSLPGASPARAHEPLRVVATTADLGALAREIGADRVRVSVLALPTQDPHWVDARPSLALELSRADLLLYVGLDLEVGWLPTLLLGARNPRIQPGAPGHLDCSQFVDVLEVPTGRVDRAQGDVHPHGNPHYMLDPRRVVRVVRGIADRLGRLQPAAASHYRSSAEALVGRIERARLDWERRLARLRGTNAVSYHRSVSYLADWLGLRFVGHVEPRPGIPPNPRHVAQLIAAARAAGARLLVQESWHPTNTSRLIAERAGMRLVVLPTGPDVRRGESWTRYMDRLVTALEAVP
ncbi:MAG: metal ABC transporter substrate-binding protein [Myxococcota bacterium]|nr:metal ABC transporter substrate-binding protein [Myxococcota bacterium]MDW8363541.1 zinc ABC transporter substrate-binding protein [Myxococcales bacterium]